MTTSRLSTGALGEPVRVNRRNGQVFGLIGAPGSGAGASDGPRPGRIPTGRRFPGRFPSANGAVRSDLPLRDSSGFAPDSLLRPHPGELTERSVNVGPQGRDLLQPSL